jgi:hypothetical protein
LFAGSELAGQRAAIVMSLVQSARLHGHEPLAYLTAYFILSRTAFQAERGRHFSVIADGISN